MTDLKSLGNAAFAAGKFKEADDLYAEALLELLASPTKANPQDFSTLHGNRAACLMKLSLPAAALEEAENACIKTPTWPKGFFRKAEALKALNKFKDAAAAYAEAASLNPGELALMTQAKLLKQKAQQEEEKSAMQRLEEHIKAHGTLAHVPVTPTYSQFTIMAELGEGNYSQVFKAKFTPTNEVFALKVIDKQKAERLSMRHGNLKSELRAERRILSKLSHPNVVKLFATFQDAKNIYYMEEYCHGRELWFKLKVIPPACLKKEWPVESKLWGLCGLRKSECQFYLAQIINAMEYLRQQGIVHRDLKPENIMVSEREDGAGDDRFARIKLIDFGTARDLLDAFDDNVADDEKKDPNADPDSDDETLQRGVPIGKKRKQTHFVGTAEFMSPEAVHGRPADHRSDLWSFGCTAFQLFTGRTPFKGASDYLTFLKADAAAYSLPKYFDKGGPEQELLESVLRVDPKERVAKAADMRKLSYFRGIDFAQLEDATYTPRVPIPSLTELCVERIGAAVWIEAEAWGEGPLSRRTYRSNALYSKRRAFEGDDEREKMNVHSLHSRLDESSKLLVRGWLEQRSVLSCSTTFKILYGEQALKDRITREQRIHNHAFLGFSQQEEGQFVDPYIIGAINDVESVKVAIGNEAHEQAKLEVMHKLNSSKPAPKLMFVYSASYSTSEATTKLRFLNSLKDETPIAKVPSNKEDEHYSLWCGGVLFIVLNAEHFDEDQASWLERELLVGKLCARYCVLVSTKKWFTRSYGNADEALKGEETSKGDAASLMSLEYRLRFIKEMQESGVQLILRMGKQDAESTQNKLVIAKSSGNEANLTQVETLAFPGKVRIVRMLPTDVLSDPYSESELTGYFHLETGELQGNSDQEDHPGKGKSAFASSTDSE